MAAATVAAERKEMIQKITRPALDLIEHIEKDLSAFRGLRVLWDNLVANGSLAMFAKDTDSIDPETLENEQKQSLHSVIYFALCLHNELWPNSEPFHSKYQRKAKRETLIEFVKEVAQSPYPNIDTDPAALLESLQARAAALLREMEEG